MKASDQMVLVRDPYYPNRTVTPSVAQNPLRPFWSGPGPSPVEPRIQPSAGPGLGYTKGGLMPSRTPSGSVLRAGRYLGAVAQRVGPSNDGAMVRQLTTHRVVGLGLAGGLGSVASTACTIGRTATGTYGAGTQAGLNFSNMDVRAVVQGFMGGVAAATQTYCPTPGAPPNPAQAPPPAPWGDTGALLLAAQAEREREAAAERARMSADKSAELAAKTETTKYLVIGGVAAAGLVALLWLRK